MVGNSILGLVFYVLLARNLTVSQFGTFSFLLALGILAAEISDLGLNAAIVKLGAGPRFPAIFTFVFRERLVTLVVLLAIFYSLGAVFEQSLIYSGLVATCLLLSFVVTQSLIARQRYFAHVAANVSGNLLRLAIVWALVSLPGLTIVSGLVAFCLGAAFTFAFGLTALLGEFKSRLWQPGNIFRRGREVFGFSLPTAVSFSLSSLAGKIDVPIVYFLSGEMFAGVYSSAQKLVSVFPQIAAAVEGVFAPKYSLGKSYSRLFRQYLLISAVGAAGVVGLMPMGRIIIPVLLGESYLGSVVVFQILLVAMVFVFLSGPFAATILYYQGKPVRHLAVAVVSFLATFGLYLYFVPWWGAVGAAAATVGGGAVAFCLYVLLAKR